MTDFNFIGKVRNFAISNHNRVNQKYDGLPYHIHLQYVVNFAHQFEYLLPENDVELAICASWCHDLIEDTGLTYNDVKKELNEDIAEVVYKLTNYKGKNRKERANDDYYNDIKNDPIALFVKICDRLGNTFHSYHYGNKRMYELYRRELPQFKEKLYNGMYDEMWELLENIDVVNTKDNFFFPDIEKFDEKTIYQIKLPKPIPFGMYNELYKKGIVPKKDLKKNTYYFGKCRNAKVALWNGFEFVYNRTKFNDTFIESINHLEDDDGYDLFVPLYQVEPEENQVIKY